MEKKKSLRPSWFAVKLHWLVSKLYFLFCGVKIKFDNEELKKYDGGFILISNHYTNNDHFFFAGGLKGKKVNYVVSSHFELQKKTRWALKFLKAITKEQFKNDINSIRKIKKVLEENGIVYIAPTGQVTLTGTDNFIPSSIVKLVRLSKVPVLAFREEGAHLCMPKWSTKKRRYPINVKVFTVITKEDLDILSDEEIYDKICKSIDVNDYEINKVKQIPIKSSGIIEGLEGALFICPKCGKKLFHETHLNTMRCTACGNTVFMDRFGFLKPASNKDKCFDTVYEWYRYQKEVIKKEILNNTFEVSGDVFLRLYDEEKKDVVDCGYGKLVLNKDEFYYEGTEKGKNIRKDFDLEHLIQTPFSPHSHIEIPDNEKFYQFKPANSKLKVIVFAIGIDVMYELKSKGE